MRIISHIKGINSLHEAGRVCLLAIHMGRRDGDCTIWRNKHFFVSRDVVFCEDQFPFAKPEVMSSDNQEEEEILWAPICDNVFDTMDQRPTFSSSPVSGPLLETLEAHDDVSPPASPILNPTETPPLSSDRSSSSHSSTSSPSSAPLPANSSALSSSSDEVVQPAPELLGRGQRRKTQSVTLKNFVVNTAQSTFLKKSGTPATYPIGNYVNCNRFSATHTAYLVAITENIEPKSFKTAMGLKQWRQAMGKEVVALEENETWTLEDLPPGKRAIGSKWVYKIKYHSDGTIERYKARLVALGNRQIEGEDYGETFAPVAKMSTVRMFLKVAAGNDWPVYQMDVHNAFLHGDLDEEVYMKPPPSFYPDAGNKVCRLRKSIYGLKQAPRCWFEKLTKSL